MLPSEFEYLKVGIIPAIIWLMGSVNATCVNIVDGDGVFFHVCGVWVGCCGLCGYCWNDVKCEAALNKVFGFLCTLVAFDDLCPSTRVEKLIWVFETETETA